MIENPYRDPGKTAITEEYARKDPELQFAKAMRREERGVRGMWTGMRTSEKLTFILVIKNTYHCPGQESESARTGKIRIRVVIT